MNDFRVVACPHPFSVSRIDRMAPVGQTVSEILVETGIDVRMLGARVFCGDRFVPEIEWSTTVPRPGDILTIRAVPKKGDGKDTLRIVLTIAVIAAAAHFAYLGYAVFGASAGTWAETVAMMSMTAVGMLAVNAICPPAIPSASTQESPAFTTSPTLSSGSNIASKYGPIPKILGYHKIIPPLGAQPYTEITGDDQYLRMLFVLGYGPLIIESPKIGDTPLHEYDGVEEERRNGYSTDSPISLVTQDIAEQSLSVKLDNADGWQMRTTGPDADEISVDITLPSGLCVIENDGSRTSRTVDFEVQWAPTGTSTWSIGGTYESYTAQESPEMDAPDYVDFWRVDRVVMHQTSGELKVVAGAQFWSGGLTVASQAATYAPPIPDWAAPIARVIRKYGDDTIAAGDITDERDTRLHRQNPSDFLPGPTSPESKKISVAAGAVNYGITVTSNRTATIRVSRRFPVDQGKYDVRIRRITADTDNSQIVDKAYWTALRTIRHQAPTNAVGLAMVALRIKATDQLNGSVSNFSCICRSIVKDWNGAAWVWRPSNNPASLYRHVLQGEGIATPIPDSQIDLTALQSWHEDCSAAGFTFNACLDYRSSVADVLKEIASAGRASPAYKDGKFSIVQDKIQTTPVQHFTPRNSWGFTGEKAFASRPHGFRVLFANENANWEQDEQVVYDDGYTADNATLFEQLTLPGVTDSDLVWSHGRYHIATARLRPESYSWYADVENLVCTRGDLVRVSHDVPMWGVAWGRVKSLTTSGGNITAVTMDEAMPMETGKSYCMRFRKSDGSSVLCNVDTDAGEPTELTLSTPIAEASGPGVGDLGLFGELNEESVELLIKSIEPGADLTARITAVDYAPAVHDADTGAIPAFDSQITLPYDVAKTIGPPVIDRIRSDETVLIRQDDGSMAPQILVNFIYSSGRLLDQVTKTEVQFRLSGSEGAWSTLTYANYVASVSITGVQSGGTYDLRFRYVLFDGTVGPWATRSNYICIGTSSLPPDVSGLVINRSLLHWDYGTKPRDFAGFEIRFHHGYDTTWSTAIAAHTGLVSASPFDVSAVGVGSKTFMVKAVDTAGNYSETAAILITDLGDALVENVVIETDYGAAGYPGTITNGSVSGSEVVADDIGTLFWSSDSNSKFWTGQASATFWNDVYKTLTYLASYTPDLTDPTTGLNLNNPKIVVDCSIEGEGAMLEYRSAGDSLFWSGDDAQTHWINDARAAWIPLGEFKVWPGELTRPSRQEYQFRQTINGGPIQGKITDFKVQIDVPDVTEDFEDVDILAAGTRLSVTKDFIKVKGVSLTLQDDGGSARTVKIIDKVRTGPLIKAYDSSGSATTAVVDARIQGY